MIDELVDRYMGCLKELRQLDMEGITKALGEAKHVYTAGNGGSSAIASHFAADLRKIAVKATSLSDNTALITALANDFGYDTVFWKQLGEIAKEDVLVVISASGNSFNVVRATLSAKARGATTIAFTGSGGGKLKELADYSINLSSHDYGEVEGIHSCLCHIIPCLIQKEIDLWKISA